MLNLYYLNMLEISLQKIYSKNEEKDIDNGEYISRMNRIIEHITTYFSLTVDIILIYFIQIFTIAIYIFSQNLLIGFILMLGITLLTILWLQTKHIIKNALIESDNFHQKSKNLNDIVNNMENILLNNQSEKYLKKIDHDNNDYGKALKQTVIINRNTAFYIGLINSILFFVILYISYQNIRKNKISSVKLGGLVIMIGYYMTTINYLGEEFPEYLLDFGQIKDSAKFFKINTKQKNNYIPTNVINPNNTSINIQNLSIKRNNKLIFENFNLSIPHRHKLAIFGKSGRGKSTLLKSIMGIVHPVNGSIQISGHDLKTHNLVDLRNKIVFIGQDTILLNKNIVDNMMEGNSATKAEVVELLTKYQLDKVFQNGINTMVEQNGNNLSKGMQKVIFMVRGLLRDGYIYLIDEPTTSLDPATKKQRSLK